MTGLLTPKFVRVFSKKNLMC